MNFTIRDMLREEHYLLDDFLYEAIFIPDGAKAPNREIINSPDLQVYISGFGKERSDICLVAQVDKKVVAAVWARIMNDYGHIDDETPSLAISVYKEYRGFGIGTKLIEGMFDRLKLLGYEKVSLAVQKENYAARMYKKIGFKTIHESDEEYLMVYYL